MGAFISDWPSVHFPCDLQAFAPHDDWMVTFGRCTPVDAIACQARFNTPIASSNAHNTLKVGGVEELLAFDIAAIDPTELPDFACAPLTRASLQGEERPKSVTRRDPSVLFAVHKVVVRLRTEVHRITVRGGLMA